MLAPVIGGDVELDAHLELLPDALMDGIHGVDRKAGQSTSSSSCCTMESAAGASSSLSLLELAEGVGLLAITLRVA
ncbi:hypothetical protein CYMTET_12827 [Cymbomonas tetramitiformis]|uniref:Uncharacterized protein n=1 Tax=Cymbomonas tetramitiformis TaxID=36881 RepID=A0AAE0GJI6_9CHLO|nr:hypothetical protein CYMTET_12827 [Cymbomonas tetramitiformis]